MLDAAALIMLGGNLEKLLQRPAGATILTPHTGEFDRLFGKSNHSFERLQKALDAAKTYNIYIILKGAYTCTATPDGDVWFNNTGNPGMATAGSGDVLTGILTGLCAQDYTPLEACLLGVYLHGLAGDLAAAALSMHAMVALDIADYLPAAWLALTT